VSVTVLSPPTVGQSLVLACDVTAVRGITSRVDIVWRSGGVTLTRRNSTTPTLNDGGMLLYTDYYAFPRTLNTTDDGREYHCDVVINTSPPVMATGSYTLDVIGK